MLLKREAAKLELVQVLDLHVIGAGHVIVGDVAVIVQGHSQQIDDFGRADC